MKLLNSLSLVVRSSLSTLEEKVQNPERMLQQLIIDIPACILMYGRLLGLRQTGPMLKPLSDYESYRPCKPD